MECVFCARIWQRSMFDKCGSDRDPLLKEGLSLLQQSVKTSPCRCLQGSLVEALRRAPVADVVVMFLTWKCRACVVELYVVQAGHSETRSVLSVFQLSWVSSPRRKRESWLLKTSCLSSGAESTARQLHASADLLVRSARLAVR